MTSPKVTWLVSGKAKAYGFLEFVSPVPQKSLTWVSGVRGDSNPLGDSTSLIGLGRLGAPFSSSLCTFRNSSVPVTLQRQEGEN